MSNIVLFSDIQHSFPAPKPCILIIETKGVPKAQPIADFEGDSMSFATPANECKCLFSRRGASSDAPFASEDANSST
jgi:hypothetical protein